MHLCTNRINVMGKQACNVHVKIIQRSHVTKRNTARIV